MPRIFTADLLFPVSGKPIPNGWIEVAADETIISIHESAAPQNAILLNGILIPGFVNAHCHLELSHLRGCISEQKGMTNFIRELISKRFTISAEEQSKAMKIAEEEMIKNGIVAVGDISNFENSISIKEKNKIYYHTFVEILGLNPDQSDAIIERGKQLQKQFSIVNNNSSTIVPHAPYSVSDLLFEKIKTSDNKITNPSTIHIEESEDENIFCRTASGPLANFYDTLGINFSAFIPSPDLSPIKRILPKLSNQRKILFVHNTFLTNEEADLAEQLIDDVYWCLCPNANLFITNQLPDFSIFNRENRNVCIGTDSLASNHQLSILEELKTIQKAAPEINFETLIKWATFNGAKFLGIEKQYGHFTPGAKPGLVLLENINPQKLEIGEGELCRRIV